MKSIHADKRAKELADMINEICIMSYDRKDFIDTLHTHFTEGSPREKDDPCYIAIKALKELKKSKVPEKALYDLVRCMELESIKVVLDVITGHLSDDHRWGVFLLDKDGKPNTRIQEGELVEMMNWEDALSKKYKKELKKDYKI